MRDRRRVPLVDTPNPSPPKPSSDQLSDTFEETLMGFYGHLDWSEEEKHYLRESGLI